MKPAILLALIALLVTPGAAIVAIDDADEERNGIIPPRDDTPPVSTLVASPSIIFWPYNVNCIPTIHVRWNGTDSDRGSGIRSYDVQYMKVPIWSDVQTLVMPWFGDWMMNTTETSATLSASSNCEYYFRVRATDNAGNVEEWPAFYDSFSVVLRLPTQACEEIHRALKELRETGPTGEEICNEEPGCPEKRKDTEPPQSSVMPLFPFHFVIRPHYFFYPMDDVTIQVYPFPPAYCPLDLLEEAGLVSATDGNAMLNVRWNGTDGPRGSGIRSYDVQYRHPHVEWLAISDAGDDAADEVYDELHTHVYNVPTVEREWSDWQVETEETSAYFEVPEEGLYQFRCRATDRAGNAEGYPLICDASVYVIDLRMPETYD